MADAEYEALRSEIIEWQGRRMATASGTVVVVTAVLGWIVQAPTRWAWTEGSAILLVAIGSAAWLTYIFGMNALRMGTYLEVFHEVAEPAWESRNADRSVPRQRWANLNSGLAVVYAALAALSVFAPWVAANGSPSPGSYALFGTAAAGALAAIVLLWRVPSQRNRQLARPTEK